MRRFHCKSVTGELAVPQRLDLSDHRSLGVFVVRQFETDQAFREERLWLIVVTV